MKTFAEIIQKRALPGILIFNQKNELVYLSGEAIDFLRSVSKNTDAADPHIPDDIYGLCSSARKGEEAKALLNVIHQNVSYSIKATPLFRSTQKSGSPSHIMIVIEKCAQRRGADLIEAKAKFNLTERESQVVGEIVKGASNQEVAAALFISEHTVKDHIKSIMNKLGVNSRAMIISKILEADSAAIY